MQAIDVVRAAARTALIAGAAIAATAQAGTVTVNGGFTSYSGPVSCPNGCDGAPGFGQSTINGVAVNPTAPSTRPGVGLVSGYALPAGTTSVAFSNPFETVNSLSFTAATSNNVNVGDEFLVGTFTYINGSWFGGLGEGKSLLAFTMTTVSTDPALNGHVYGDILQLTVTQGGAGVTPEQGADYFSFVGRPDLGTLSVYELDATHSNVGSFNFYAKIGSLIPTRFEAVPLNANGAPTGGFVGNQTVPVPEPTTWAMMLGGLALLAGTARRRR